MRHTENAAVLFGDLRERHAAYVTGRQGPPHSPDAVVQFSSIRCLTVNSILAVDWLPYSERDPDRSVSGWDVAVGWLVVMWHHFHRGLGPNDPANSGGAPVSLESSK
jgi:hypothetical protein